MFYFAPVEKLDQQGWETTKLLLDPYDFFVPVRQSNQVDVLEREIGDGAILKYALVGLPAASPHRVSSREERERQENPWNIKVYPEIDRPII